MWTRNDDTRDFDHTVAPVRGVEQYWVMRDQGYWRSLPCGAWLAPYRLGRHSTCVRSLPCGGVD